MKRHLLFLIGLGAAMKVAAGIAPPYGWTSEPMTLDIESGVRQTVGVESLAYDAACGDGETNAYAYVTATYDAKRNSFTLSGKLWDGTVVSGTAYPLAKETADGGHVLSPLLLTDKAKNAVYLELSDDGSRARVLENGENGEKVAIGKDGTTPWSQYHLVDDFKGETFASVVPEATACDVLADATSSLVDAASSPRQNEVTILFTQKDRGTKLSTNGLLKLTLTDVYGWKWACEMLPVDNDGTQFRGIATGTKKGEAMQCVPVWSK